MTRKGPSPTRRRPGPGGRRRARNGAFTLVLGGGGARGFAHAGVLRALEHDGMAPAALVGVSMGAVVAVAYALRDDWYEALLELDLAAFPGPLPSWTPPPAAALRWRRRLALLVAGWDLLAHWGLGQRSVGAVHEALGLLTGHRRLEEARPPVVVCATDLITGGRTLLDRGDAARAAYASAALAGIFPPLARHGRLLADGAYVDLAPVDAARAFRHPVVAVDAGQSLTGSEVHNGLQVLLRAVEICQGAHAHLRFQEADIVLRPTFRRPIDTLDLGARRESVAAGVRAVRRARAELGELATRHESGPPPSPAPTSRKDPRS